MPTKTINSTKKVINNIINIQMTDIKTIIEGSLIPLTLEKLKYAWTGSRGNHTFFGATSTALIFPKKDGEARVSEQEFRFAFIETINAYNAYVETINKQNGADVDSDKIYYSVETPTNDTYLFKGETPKVVKKDEGIRSKRGSFDLTLYDADKKVIALIEFKANWTKPHDVWKDLLKLQNPNEGNEGCDNSDVKRYFLWLFRNYNQNTENYIKKAIEEAKDFYHVNCLCYALSDIECGRKEPFYASTDNTDK
jgi:hypothetical protein